MCCFVVVLLILLKDPAKQDGTGNKHQICSDDREDDRDEKPNKRRQWLLDPDSDIVSGSKDDKTQYTYDPVGLRGLLSGLVRTDEIYRACKSYASYRIEEYQEEDNAVNNDCCHQRRN